jgi:hypothetical protein
MSSFIERGAIHESVSRTREYIRKRKQNNHTTAEGYETGLQPREAKFLSHGKSVFLAS